MGDTSESEDLLKDYCIPDYVLGLGPIPENGSSPPTCPVIVFVNSKSGGQLGGDLLVTYRSLLNRNQVFDLRERYPGEVLQQLYMTLERLQHDGDVLAGEIQRRLRIIVAGGDGTANWLLGLVSDLRFPQPPPIATMPLGTGNNLPFSFGWGKKNPGTNKQSVMSFLNQVKSAEEMKIDGWRIIMRMKTSEEGACDPIAPGEKSSTLHAFRRVHDNDKLNKEGFHTFHGRFWSYFSMGMDAQVSYGFHSKRELHPEKFKKQLVNQVYCLSKEAKICSNDSINEHNQRVTSHVRRRSRATVSKDPLDNMHNLNLNLVGYFTVQTPLCWSSAGFRHIHF